MLCALASRCGGVGSSRWPRVAGRTGLVPSGTFFDEHRPPSTRIESSRPDSLPIENCFRHVSVFKRSSVKFRRPKIRSVEMCAFELRIAENGTPELCSIQVRAPEIRPFQMHIVELGAAQIRVTKIEFVELVETPGR